MPDLRLQPNHKPVRDYYASLKQYSLLHATHEGAVAEAFGTLLAQCGRQFNWTLVQQFEIKRKRQHALRVDGALLDPWSLEHGMWEAKDQDDDLATEAKKKIDKGYPTHNILFQAPDRAILYQGGKRILDERIVEPLALVDVLREFFRYQPPAFDQWERAVAEFREKVPQLGKALLDLIEKERKENPFFVRALAQFVDVCRGSLNPSLSETAVEKMLAQHILTERVFRTVFDNADFVRRNAVAAEIEEVVDQLTRRAWNREKFLGGLDRFYGAIEETARTIDDFSEKQGFLNAVYENFFQSFDAKTADTHGIVYTPQSIVKFMVRSVDEILKTEFGSSLGDPGVHVLDPFVGTGNFLLHIMRQIPKTRLSKKYATELHANEVLLLPYYVASMNIEHDYAEATGEYRPFEGLCLVDTFELAEAKQQSFTAMTEKNAARVEKQRKSPITVIIGNPPYNANQADENDNNKNRSYRILDDRIRDTYSARSSARKLKTSDPYIRAFRWASDRLGDSGVLAYVTNSIHLDFSLDGMRRCLVDEWDNIWVLDLGGNVHKNPKLSGTTHNVFGVQVGVAITILARKPRPAGAGRRTARVMYAQTPATAKKAEKFAFLDSHGDYSAVEWKEVVPDTHGSWLHEDQDASFDTLLPMVAREGQAAMGVFEMTSLGVSTNRDSVAWNFDHDGLARTTKAFASAYNSAVGRYIEAGRPANVDSFVEDEPIKWSRNLKRALVAGRRIEWSTPSLVTGMYRPFTRERLYFGTTIADELGQLRRMFSGAGEGLTICVTDRGSEKPFLCLAVGCVPDLHFVGPGAGTKCFPFHTIEADGRRENITDWALAEFRRHYGDKRITKRDIFHYVYALLHHPKYRTRYEANLRRELPRIPFAADFRGFAKAGKRLVELHVEYERQREWPLARVEAAGQPLSWRVERMKLMRDKRGIVYNDFLTLTGIPPEAFEYRLGNRSAIEWIIDQYQVSTDPRSGITNDPNRLDDPEYIVRLIGQVITISVETMEIVRGLPALEVLGR